MQILVLCMFASSVSCSMFLRKCATVFGCPEYFDCRPDGRQGVRFGNRTLYHELAAARQRDPHANVVTEIDDLLERPCETAPGMPVEPRSLGTDLHPLRAQRHRDCVSVLDGLDQRTVDARVPGCHPNGAAAVRNSLEAA